MRFFFFILILFFSGCDRNVTSEYETMSEAISDRLFQRGWLPNILPSTTINIKTVNDLDTNKSHGHFEIPINEIEKFTSQFSVKSDGILIYKKWVFEVNGNDGKVLYKLNGI